MEWGKKIDETLGSPRRAFILGAALFAGVGGVAGMELSFRSSKALARERNDQLVQVTEEVSRISATIYRVQDDVTALARNCFQLLHGEELTSRESDDDLDVSPPSSTAIGDIKFFKLTPTCEDMLGRKIPEVQQALSANATFPEGVSVMIGNDIKTVPIDISDITLSCEPPVSGNH